MNPESDRPAYRRSVRVRRPRRSVTPARAASSRDVTLGPRGRGAHDRRRCHRCVVNMLSEGDLRFDIRGKLVESAGATREPDTRDESVAPNVLEHVDSQALDSASDLWDSADPGLGSDRWSLWVPPWIPLRTSRTRRALRLRHTVREAATPIERSVEIRFQEGSRVT